MKQLLTESANLLRKDPILFLPKISSSLLSSLWIIGFLNFSNMRLILLASFPLIIILGLIAPILLADLVKNYPNYAFPQSLKTLLTSWKEITFFILLIFSLSFILSILTLSSLYIHIYTEMIILSIILIFVTFLIAILSSFLIYFMPITLLEAEKTVNTFIYSAKTSLSYKKEVLLLMIISITLLLLGLLGQGVVEGIGYIGFIFSRVISAAFSTYIFTLIPRFYLEKER